MRAACIVNGESTFVIMNRMLPFSLPPCITCSPSAVMTRSVRKLNLSLVRPICNIYNGYGRGILNGVQFILRILISMANCICTSVDIVLS